MEWISFKDRLPEKDGTAYLGYERYNFFVFSFSYGDWHEISQSEISYEVNPSYWMPLPQPPKDD